ncbi:OmpW family outer membrane protein [Cytophaga aurantiaca]|uniref:OmpW family outer membrane protein n=1 Tax=Cytophaga aurantiaca TaxID=29530 RepID=UPI0003618D3A|nr:OmpW family outer membrane protein [Cytophaga aurantiaca]
MKKLYILFLLFISVTTQSIAQVGENYLTLHYSTALGLGNTHDGISKMSFRGASFEYKKFTSDQVALGFDFNWNVLYEKKSYDTYTIGTASLSGTQYRSLNVLPFMATVDYFFADNDHVIQPFVGLGVGAVYSIENVDMGLYRYNTKDWHTGFKPQIGLWYYLNETTKLSVSSEFLYAFKTSSTAKRELLTFNIGFAFTPY